MIRRANDELARRLVSLHHRINAAELLGDGDAVDALYKEVYELEAVMRDDVHKVLDEARANGEMFVSPTLESSESVDEARVEYRRLKGEYEFLKSEHRRLKRTYAERRKEFSPREKRVMREEISRVGGEKVVALHALPSLADVRERYAKAEKKDYEEGDL